MLALRSQLGDQAEQLETERTARHVAEVETAKVRQERDDKEVERQNMLEKCICSHFVFLFPESARQLL